MMQCIIRCGRGEINKTDLFGQVFDGLSRKVWFTHAGCTAMVCRTGGFTMALRIGTICPCSGHWAWS